MHCPDLVLFIPPLFSEQLRRRTNDLLSRIVRANYNTQFAQTAAELAVLRDATAGLVDGMDHDDLSESFRKTVEFTTYDAYAPLIARFFEKQCKASAVVDLLAPGLPDYIARSTSTSGGLPKLFPLYDRLSKIESSDNYSWAMSNSPRRRTTAYLSQFWCDSIFVEDEKDRLVKPVYLGSVAVINRRLPLNLHPEKDEEKMSTFILDHAAPYATGFIRKYRSYLLIHVLFAVGSRSLETMTIPYTSVFVDMMRHLDMEFDLVVSCIASGTIPDLDGMAEVRPYFEVIVFPDPERAAELRSLGRPSSRPGWCSYAWPNLHSITTTASGSFATYIPSTRWFLGHNVDIRSRGYRSTEAVIALPFNPLELNQYKLVCENVTEFLDITEDDSVSSLVQIWEVEVGRRYEIVLTTRDGLWRYRLGDVVEVSGFDSTDGVPVIQFIERRNMAIRFDDFMVGEKELSAAILLMAPITTVQIVGWTATIDDRYVPATIGFFVELACDQGMDTACLIVFAPLAHENMSDHLWPVPDLAMAIERVVGELSRSDENIAYAIEHDSFHKPTIRLVQPGTFSEFLERKLHEGGGTNFGQIKVPAVVLNAAHVMWFLNHVMQEL